MKRDTGIIQRSAEDGFKIAYPCDSNHMSAYSCLGMRSDFHHQGFHTRPTSNNPYGWWLEVWWTTDTRTGAVTDIFEDTRGLNRR